MIERILVNIIIMSLFLTKVKAKLDINQKEYSNPSSVYNLSKVLPVVEDSPKEQASQVNAETTTVEIPPTNPDKIDTIHQELRFLDFSSKDDVIVKSHDVPKIPSKFIGPKRKPFKTQPFQGVGPSGMEDHEKPSCDEFSKTARFNPYSVLNEKWFNFYRWDYDNVPMILEFFVPTSWEIVNMRKFLDKQVPSHQLINWDSRLLVMNDIMYNISALLVEQNDHGLFLLYPITPNITEPVEGEDVRFKQTADNRFIAFVICRDDRAFIFSRIKEVPLKDDIPDAVASLGWRGRDGKSYLYQGEKWVPVPDVNEEEYWRPYKKPREYLPPSPEVYDPEKDDVKIFGKRY